MWVIHKERALFADASIYWHRYIVGYYFHWRIKLRVFILCEWVSVLYIWRQLVKKYMHTVHIQTGRPIFLKSRKVLNWWFEWADVLTRASRPTMGPNGLFWPKNLKHVYCEVSINAFNYINTYIRIYNGYLSYVYIS